MNTHQWKGRISQATGKAKEMAGRFLRNRSLEGKGRVESAGGKLRAGYGDVKDDITNPNDTRQKPG